MATGRAQAKKEIGIVTSTKMAKTISVNVERLVKHPRYGMYIRRRTRLVAHDENEIAKAGDQVEISFTRPLSKTKRWRLVRVVRPASLGTNMDTNVPPAATEETHQEG